MQNLSPKDRLPLQPAAFHMLLSLADRDLHGYAIMKDVERISGGQIKLGPGTLYGTLKRMLTAGFVEESDERPDPELDDSRRRYYRLTLAGRKILQVEVERLSNIVDVAKAKKIWVQ